MYKINQLANGVKTVTVPMRGTKTATILVIVGTGSKYETRENNGISHFLEHMFFKGTKKRPTTQAISNELDSMGAEFNAFTGKEYTGYYVKAEAGKIELAMDIVSDMLLNSKFDANEIKREKGVIIEEMNMYLDNPLYSIEDRFEECLYGDTAAGWDTIGTRENILNFKRNDFIEYLSAQYGAHNITLCLAGNIGASTKNVELLSKYFSNGVFKERDTGFKEKEPVEEMQREPAVKLEYKKTDQAHLSLGVRTFGYGHKDRLVAKMLSIVLGGSMSSRLFINLRERKGLAYYVRTDSESYTDCGYLTTRAGVPLGKLKEAIKTILKEYRSIRTDIGKEELERAKDLLRGRLAISLEASDSQANWYAKQAVMLGTLARESGDMRLLKRMADPEEFLESLDKIKAADISRVAKRIFVKRNLNLAIVGPHKDEAEFKGLLKI